ncbi:MAG TPA: hypothetical protein VKX45_04915 [Bryobacteraceae bacterium]|jgi:tetratricopeptide (TPR) repeat protein|nr:hypothetical protein [Bryobacteraceae bacterium]
MRASVLNDAALVKRAGQFAWLSVDVDDPANASFMAKAPAEGVPMFLVIDSATGKIALSWYGAATAAQLDAMLDDGAAVIAGKASGADAVLARADRANAEKDFVNAAAYYEQALNLGGTKWAKRPRALESLIMAQSFAHKNEDCAATALREAPTMARDRSLVNVLYFGLECTKPGTPQRIALLKLAEQAVKTPGVLSDDISQLYGEIAYGYRAEKDEGATSRVATEWVAYLRRERAKAASPDARFGLDLQLASAASVLRKPEIALPEIERDERELPKDYNPPRVAASLLSQMGRLDDAVAACSRALELAYGAAKLRMYGVCGGILSRKGDKDAAKKMYQDGIAFGRTLPEDVAQPVVRSLEAALGKL